jgi:2-dehydro-3-deoxygluconokinase
MCDAQLVTRIVFIGEAMLELASDGERWRMGYGGDTLNTAIHLARLGHDVAYLTALGCDPMSAELKQKWALEGLDTSLVLDHPGRNTGLYAISTDVTGERSFSYWRDTSAARDMFSLAGMETALGEAEKADLIAYSLITLAVLPERARASLLELNARLAFDGNYRARLWSGRAAAAGVRDAAIARASIGLPTLEDEQQISGEITADMVANHWRALGCDEAVVKMGAKGCRLPCGRVIAPPKVLQPVDTSGAGDAFNAGYLHARLAGATPLEAANEGHRLAGWVIMRPGAIPPRVSL